MDKYRLNDNIQSLVSYFWGVSDVLLLLWTACKLLSFEHRNEVLCKVKKKSHWWQMVLNSVFDKVSSLFFCLSYFFFQSLTTLIWMFVSKMSIYINEMLPTVLVFTVSTCQVNKQFSFLGLTQKSNLKKVTFFLISVHITAV